MTKYIIDITNRIPTYDSIVETVYMKTKCRKDKVIMIYTPAIYDSLLNSMINELGKPIVEQDDIRINYTNKSLCNLDLLSARMIESAISIVERVIIVGQMEVGV